MTAIFISSIGFISLKAQKQKNMENQIREVVLTIEKAASQRDVNLISPHLHDQYRVVANRFKGSNSTTVIPKELYLNMMREGKIGGTAYEVLFDDIKINRHTAVVDLTYVSKTAPDMHKYLILVQDKDDQWKVVSDIPIVIDE